MIYDRQYLYDTGNVSVKRKFDVSLIQEGEYVSIMMDRVLLKEDVDKSLEKRNTGFELSWYFEDGSGNRVEIEEESKFKDKMENQRFIALVVPDPQ